MSYPISRRIIGSMLKLRFASVQGLENLPRNGPVILASNHIGLHDPLLLAAALIMHTDGRKVHCIAKWPIFRLPIFGYWLGSVPLYSDRKKTLALVEKKILQGELVLIYPEGKVNYSEIIGRGKTGAARLALKTRVPLIPIGLRRTSPPKKNLAGELLEMAYARLHINIGSPLDLSHWFGKNINPALLADVNEKIMSAIGALAEKKYQL